MCPCYAVSYFLDSTQVDRKISCYGRHIHTALRKAFLYRPDLFIGQLRVSVLLAAMNRSVATLLQITGIIKVSTIIKMIRVTARLIVAFVEDTLGGLTKCEYVGNAMGQKCFEIGRAHV